MEFSKVVSELLKNMQHIASSETVVGKPIEVENAKVIPVNHLRLGFGAGFGNPTDAEGKALGAGGAGGGVSVEPQAFIVVNNEGQAHLLTLKGDKKSTVVRAIEVLPEVVEKVMETGSRYMGGNKEAAGAADDESGG